MSLQEFREWFDPRFSEVISDRILEVAGMTDNQELLDALRRVQRISATGKRIRPYIIALAYTAGGKSREEIVSALVGIELFHAFCLIHDDVIDRAALRRGEETVHAYFLRTMLAREARGDVGHLSNSQAVLVGDLVFGWALDALYSSIGANAAAWREVRMMMDEVVVGQMLDVDLMTSAQAEQADILAKMYFKTASYTFVRPLRIGFALAGLNGDYFAFADAFGRELGIGFQIQDDLLDVIGDEEKTGKRLFSDVRDGQHTYLSMKIRSEGSVEDKEFFEGFFGRDFREEERGQLRDFFEKNDVVQNVRQIMDGHFESAKSVLDSGAVKDELRGQFSDLLGKIVKRLS